MDLQSFHCYLITACWSLDSSYLNDDHFTPKPSPSHLDYHYKKIKTKNSDIIKKGLGRTKKQRHGHYLRTTSTPPEYNKIKQKLKKDIETNHSTNKKMFLRQQNRISNTNIENKQNDVSNNFACKHFSNCKTGCPETEMNST